MSNLPVATRYEPRWPVMCAIVIVIALLTVLPGIIRLLPVWIAYIIGAVILVPMAAVNLSAARARWLRIERTVVTILVVAARAINILG